MTSFLSSIGRGPATPAIQDLVTTAEGAALVIIDDRCSPERHAAAEELLCKRLNQIKLILYGSSEHPVDEAKARDLAKCVQGADLLIPLITHIDIMPFEARKDTALIFNNCLRKHGTDFAPYVFRNFDAFVPRLVEGYANPDAGLSCGSMLRECIRHDDLARTLLNSELLWLFFDSYVQLPNFDVALDSFNTLRDLLVCSKNKLIASSFLEANYDVVFRKYEVLLLSENYVTRRRSLKLLGELLLERSNFNVMIRYIASKHNLKIIMNLLRDKSAHIQFEAFHVFKVFVANPNKPPEISSILFKNKVKLIAYLENFHLDKDDPQFNDEKQLLLV